MYNFNYNDMFSTRVKDWMVADEWETMDQAIYSTIKLKLLNGSYWFWLMSDYNHDNPSMLQVIISQGAVNYTLNNKKFICKHINDESFECYCGIWQYKDGEVRDIIHDNCSCTVRSGEFSCVTESGYHISISHTFPFYNLQVLKGNSMITKFQAISTPFTRGYFQNPAVSYPSKMGFSDDFDAYARNSRGFQHIIASKMSDLFSTCKGTLFDRDFYGSFWLERALGFGSTLPWKIIMVNFNDRSRLWYRYFPSRILNYGTPLEFIFDDITTKKRYTFNEMTIKYTGRNLSATEKFGASVDTVHLTGKGDRGETLHLDAKILGRHLYQYTILPVVKFNYNQIVLDINDLDIQADDNDLLQGKKTTLSYGEDAYFSL